MCACIQAGMGLNSTAEQQENTAHRGLSRTWQGIHNLKHNALKTMCVNLWKSRRTTCTYSSALTFATGDRPGGSEAPGGQAAMKVDAEPVLREDCVGCSCPFCSLNAAIELYHYF